jgi:hypothetical protein
VKPREDTRKDAGPPNQLPGLASPGVRRRPELIASATKLQDFEGAPARRATMAVAIKIEDQRLHVQWWDRTVRPAGGDQKGENHFRRDAEMIPMVDAEAATGISYQIVSR